VAYCGRRSRQLQVVGATKVGDGGKGGWCVSGGMQATGWIRRVKGAGGDWFGDEAYIILVPRQLGIVGYMVGWISQVKEGFQMQVD